MAGTTNPTDTINGAANSTAPGTYTPSTTPSSDSSSGPDYTSLYNDILTDYQAQNAIIAKGQGADNPGYWDALATRKDDQARLVSMANNIESNKQRATTAAAKSTPSADQPFIAPDGTEGWPDGKGGVQKGTWGDYYKWEATHNAELNTALKAAQDDFDKYVKKSTIDIAQNKLDATTAQNNTMDLLNQYKAQLGPMVSALGAARDIADMTLRGPIIPSLLQNMAPNGTNAAIVGMLNGTPGVTKIPASSGLGQDQPLPVDINTLGTQIAQTALKTFGPWAQQASQQAANGNIGGGQAASGNVAPAHAPITNSQPQMPPYLAPSQGIPLGGSSAASNAGALPTSSALPPASATSPMVNNPGVATPNGQMVVPPQTAGANVMNPMLGGPFTAGVNPVTGQPLAMH